MRTNNQTLAAAMDILAREIHCEDGVATAAIAEAADRIRELDADKSRLDWLCDYITNKGLDGMQKIAWTVYDEDGKSLMDRETVSDDEVEEIKFDRAAIDAAMTSPNNVI
jgi:C4-type Zn-finger protein